MGNSYYEDRISDFLEKDKNEILGCLVENNEFDLDDNQKRAWIKEIEILKEEFFDFDRGFISFEYTIPRIGKRIDNVLLYKGIVFLLEFKVGSKTYNSYDIDQVYDYGLDLKNFHEESLDKYIVPILVSTEAYGRDIDIEVRKDKLLKPILCNKNNLRATIVSISKAYGDGEIDYDSWINSRYRPTPTIIEAAQALYKGHKVEDISRSDSGVENLNITLDYIDKVIEDSKNNKKKSICFLTGVPGAGKTLAGLNIGSSRQKYEEEEHAVFLSGNGPLVEVLREALARDDKKYNDVTMDEARRKSSVFIQNIHHFRDNAIKDERPPLEKVVIFDEAQRAWNKEETAKFMKKKAIDLKKSEANFLISVMDRHDDWACIICLIGNGQEIHKGEAGLKEWFNSIEEFDNWEVHASKKIVDNNIIDGVDNIRFTSRYHLVDELHLSTSIRSFRSENLANFVEKLLNLEKVAASNIYEKLKDKYPIYVTRDLNMAKRFLKESSRGNERYGLVASSDARRLKAVGLDVKNDIDVSNWFLGGKDDVRSSYYLEDVATEFDIQGLELDWVCLAWGGDLRYIDKKWDYKSFRGTKWQNINQEIKRIYKKNSYRVLLTRARQGLVIYVPFGDEDDHTRKNKYYDGSYKYLREVGIEELTDKYFNDLLLKSSL